MDMKIKCPHCGVGLNLPAAALGKSLRCPKCKQSFRADPPEPEEAEAIVIEPDPEPAEDEPVGQFGFADDGADDRTAAKKAFADRYHPDAVEKDARERKERVRRRVEKAERKAGYRSSGGSLETPVWLKAGGLVAGLLGVFLAGYLLTRRPTADEIPASAWLPFEQPGLVRLSLPGSPTKQTQTAAGATFSMFAVQPDKDGFYALGVTDNDLPAHRLALPVEDLLTDSCNGAMANMERMGGTEVSRRTLTDAPYPGKELIVDIPAARGMSVNRVYLVRGKLVMVLAAGRGLSPDHPNVRRLLASVEFPDPPPDAPKPEAKPTTAPATPAWLLGERPLPADAGRPVAFAFNAAGDTLAVFGDTGRKLWLDPDGTRPTVEWPDPASPTPSADKIALSPDGKRWARVAPGGNLTVTDRDRQRETNLRPAGGSNTPGPPAFSPDGKLVGSVEGTPMGATFVAYDLATGEKAWDTGPVEGPPRSAAFSADGSLLAVGGNFIRLWDVAAGKPATMIARVGTGGVNGLAFAPDGKRLAGYIDGLVYIWTLGPDRVPVGEPKQLRLTGLARGVAWGPGGELYTVSDRVQQWDAATGTKKREFTTGLASPLAVAVRPADGRLAVWVAGPRVMFLDPGKE